MSYNENTQAIDSINRSAATTETYVKSEFNIKTHDDETRNVISSTFGLIKHNLEALWYSVGLDPNVNIAYEKALNDPNQCIEVQGKKFYPHPGVGNLKAYNEAGNPAGGCFSMQTLA